MNPAKQAGSIWRSGRHCICQRSKSALLQRCILIHSRYASISILQHHRSPVVHPSPRRDHNPAPRRPSFTSETPIHQPQRRDHSRTVTRRPVLSSSRDQPTRAFTTRTAKGSMWTSLSRLRKWHENKKFTKAERYVIGPYFESGILFEQGNFDL